MLMVADAGEGGVKNHPKSADVVYGRSQIIEQAELNRAFLQDMASLAELF